METIKKITEKAGFRYAIWVVGGLLIFFVTLSIGIQLGLNKAQHSYQWGKNYEHNFIGDQRKMMEMGPHINDRGHMMRPGEIPEMARNFEGKNFKNGHGIAGVIISTSENSIVIKERDEKENIISVDEKTLIKKGNDNISINNLQKDEFIVVIGQPSDNGMVKADLIRVLEKNNNFNK